MEGSILRGWSRPAGWPAAPSPYHRRHRLAPRARSTTENPSISGVKRLIPICFALATGVSPPPAQTTTLSLQPTPLAAAERQRMRQWSHDALSRISPVLREWDSLARATRQRPGQPLPAGCRRLDLALRDLAEVDLSAAPDPAAALHLERTLRALREAARSCANGAWFLTSWRLGQADASWRELRGRLRLFDLAP